MSSSADWEDLEEERQEELNPKRTISHKCFRMVKLVALVCALAMGIGQIVGIAFPGEGLDPIQWVLHMYMLGFCVVMILTELEWGQFLIGSPTLSNWISRGILYSFVGVIGISENRVMSVEDSDSGGALPKTAAMYVEVVAYGMVAVGLVYFAMGAFCCQLFYNSARKDYEERAGFADKKRKKEAKRNRSKPVAAAASSATREGSVV
jgi:hypothetical protein